MVLVPGWGVIPSGYQDFYQSVRGKAEFFYIETREKGSSRIRGRRPDLSPGRGAHDIGAALDALGLSGKRDFVLTGVCWGSTLILEGLREGVIDAPTILVADPMHTLWFPKWLLRYVAPSRLHSSSGPCGGSSWRRGTSSSSARWAGSGRRSSF